ncbi:MAG: carbohydrate-binding domain-containing protein [Prevotella sp.]
MKRLYTLLFIAITALVANAQTLNVKAGNVIYSFPASQAGDMIYQDATSVTILGRTFDLTNIEKMYVDETEVKDNTVSVAFDGEVAKVNIAGNIAQYVDATVSGAHVSLVQSKNVGDDTCGEITYNLSGASDDGGLYMEGSYKATLKLQGLSLVNPSGAALDIQIGKRIAISISDGTVNSLTDGADGGQKGCITCKGHIELKGHGTLNVTGNASHAIYAKEYVEMKNCTVNVLKAVKDGVNCNQYFLLSSGELNIDGTGDDGIQTAFKDDTDREDEDTGTITIAGGTLTAAITATAAKALKADGDIVVTGGTLTLSTAGGGQWDSEESKTKAAACLSADGQVTIDGGDINLTSTGSGGKGISCDGAFTANDGTITIKTSGGLYAYVNGIEYNDYTGNTDNIASDYKSSPKGIKADGNVNINGGNISIVVTGNGAEGIESKAELTISDGTINITSNDDGINSASDLYIKGGDITVVATNNDAIDSNGSIYVSGGTTRALGPGSMECGLDADERHYVYFTGGTLIAVGGQNSMPTTTTTSQPYVTGSATISAGSTVQLKDGTTVLASFDIPDNYSFTGTTNSPGGKTATFAGGWQPGGPGSNSSGGTIIITCPGLTTGSTYSLVSGTSTTSVTAK